MADMVDSGRHCFQAWARQEPAPSTGQCFYNRWLGEFDPDMSAAEVNRRLEGDKLTESAQVAFMRGWESAQAKHRTGLTP